jgi:hypothetical protein
MQLRIFTYKVTFEEIPHWYWGVHKEKKINDGYLGSPVTHAWMWEFYTPHLQVLEVFPCTEEGWKEANLVEDRIIKPDINNPLCLNEGYGMRVSLEICRRNGEKLKEAVHREKDENGKSLHAIKMGQVGGKAKTPAKRNGGLKCKELKIGFHSMPREERQKLSRQIGVRQRDEKKGIHLQTPEEKHEMGKNSMSMLYTDPDHPELGEKAAPVLANMQKSRGYPYGPQNRVRVK